MSLYRVMIPESLRGKVTCCLADWLADYTVIEWLIDSLHGYEVIGWLVTQ